MKIVVLNGSPKGEVSITMQYMTYIKENFKHHEFDFIHISHDIKKIEREPELFEAILRKVESSDGVLWAFPLYYALVPSQYKRFIELIFEKEAAAAFEGKYAGTLTTSIHFYDTAASNYMNAICDDLKMRYVGEFLADMHDLELPAQRKNLLTFAEYFFTAIEHHAMMPRNFDPITNNIPPYTPADILEEAKTGDKKIVILTDESGTDSNLSRMIDVFMKSTAEKAEVVDLSRVNIKGGCLGCLNCGYDNTCVYKDDLKDICENKLLTADAIIIAGTVKDRYLSSTWKMFFDRHFRNGHTPFLMGKIAGAIISGPLRQIPNLRQILELFSQAGKNNNIGIITDEYESSETITALLQDFALQLSWVLQNDLVKPQTFLGFSSHLIFRDFIYLTRGVFRADHRYAKQAGIYDFPQKKIKLRAQSLLLSTMNGIRPLRKQIQRDMKHHMIGGLQKIANEK